MVINVYIINFHLCENNYIYDENMTMFECSNISSIIIFWHNVSGM